MLLVTGVILLLYSSWFQDSLRSQIVKKLNSIPGMEVSIGRFDLHFPLTLDMADVALAQNGDTLLSAGAIQADVALLPLFKGEVSVRRAFLSNALYNMGNADSIMQMLIYADSLLISPASIGLAPLDIDIADGEIVRGGVEMISRPDTAAATAASDSAAYMRIRLGSLRLKDFTYKMRMLPTIDSLGATVGVGTLSNGMIDMKKQLVSIGSFTGSGLDAAYIAPDSATIASTPVPPASDVQSAPWTVTIDSIHFADSRGLYTTRGVTPLPGLDFAYIQADSMDITVTDFYNQATAISLPIKLSATERCGLRLDASGTFSMDSTAMHFDTFHITAPGTDIAANGLLGMGDMLTDSNLPMRLAADGHIGIPALETMFPAFKAYLAPLPAAEPLQFTMDVDGTAGNLKISEAALKINRIATIKAKGNLRDMFAAKGPNGELAFSGSIIDVSGMLRDYLAGTPIAVPPMTLDGHAEMEKGVMSGNLQAHTLGGSLAMDARFDASKEGYGLDLATNDFPVGAFVKDMGLGAATVDLKVEGQGYDPFKSATTINVDGKIKSLVYQGYDYQGITLSAVLHDGKANIDATAANSALDVKINANGNLDGEVYNWTAAIDGSRIDLEKMKMSDVPAVVSVSMTGDASVTAATKAIKANMEIKDMHYKHQTGEIAVSDVRARFITNDTATHATVLNRDLMLLASSPMGIAPMMTRIDSAMVVLQKQLDNKQLAVDTLQKVLPQFNIYLAAGANNLINDILADSKMSVRNMKLSAMNDSALSLRAQATGIRSGAQNIDTIGLKVAQDDSRISLVAKMDNRPGTFDNFAHVRLDALANNQKVALRATQQNIQGKTGFDIGAITMFQDSTVTARLFPLNPVIGYKNWTVNLDNYISYTIPTKKIDANLKMHGDKSSLALFTVPDSIDDQNDLALQLTDIHISDWIVINPFAPPITGDISADMRVKWDGGANINGRGNVSLTDFTYGKQPVGTFLSNLEISTSTAGTIRANADLLVNGEKAMTLAGVLNDSTATTPFDLDLALIRFPLSVANPFMPEGTVSLTGTLNGEMCVSGDASRPLINGEIDFEKSAVKLAMTGTDYALSDVQIPVKDNVISFNDFGIKGANDNPLLINGTVDMSALMMPKINLSLKADNMMLINTRKAARGANIFGKAFVDLNATAKGDMRFLDVKANLAVLSGSNVTYMLTDAETMMQNSGRNDGMVKFVNFNDSTAVVEADSISDSAMMMALDATLNIQNGVTFTVDLSSTTRDKVEIQPEGSVNYIMTPLSDEGRLTGRININGGLARYTIPVIGQEKSFTFDPGSYVAFNGNMMNPVLNIHATDQIKANVTQQGQNSRLVNFDVLLAVTGTLETMNVKFDLATNDDLTVANELQGMTAEQRANQAMNMLLYNVYTGPGTRGNGNIGANPLFSFLESQVNNWAANNIKGVDISFGIDQYNQTTNGTTSQAMNYSYQVSKSLFNDRFKIVVGGNYSTDETSDESLSESLINDISFEYYLNKKRTMLIKIFRHTGYESILEGEITQTGVGFVYKKRLSRLSDMLPKFMRPKRKTYVIPEPKEQER